MKANTPELRNELKEYKRLLADMENSVNEIRIEKPLLGVDGNASMKFSYSLRYAQAYLKTAQENIDEALATLKEREDGA